MTQKNKKAMNKPIYIVDSVRTPFLKARGKPGPFSASDLAVQAGRVLLSKNNIKPADLSEVVLGCMMPSEKEANIGRLVALRLGCGDEVPGWTVQRNCASGMQALDCGIKDILSGRADLVLAGGTEAMSRAPLIMNKKMTAWFARLAKAKTAGQKLSIMAQFRPGFIKPIIALLCGLTDPVYGINMGQTAEEIAFDFNITREDMDQYAEQSQQRAAFAKDHEGLSSITAIYDDNGNAYQDDDGIRPDSSMAKLAKLKPFFDKQFGSVTPANSSQVTDGASLMILASEEAVKKYNLKPRAKIVDVNWAALDPKVMGLGPVFAALPMLKRNKLTKDDVDYWEINEAFAAQVLGCLKAMDDADFCKKNFSRKEAFGLLDEAELNKHGGAIALGHPVGASGARIVDEVVKVLEEEGKQRGVAAICIGGGQGGAMLIERIDPNQSSDSQGEAK
jgi:acetyl-CoA C-acetyltransferase